MEATEEEFQTVDELLDRLGGTEKAAIVLGEQRWRTVAIWKHRKRMPANKYEKHKSILDHRGIKASPLIWGQQVTEARPQ